jgi:hypothetical protein
MMFYASMSELQGQTFLEFQIQAISRQRSQLLN